MTSHRPLLTELLVLPKIKQLGVGSARRLFSEACVFRTKGNRDDIDETRQHLKEDVELL